MSQASWQASGASQERGLSCRQGFQTQGTAESISINNNGLSRLLDSHHLRLADSRTNKWSLAGLKGSPPCLHLAKAPSQACPERIHISSFAGRVVSMKRGSHLRSVSRYRLATWTLTLTATGSGCGSRRHASKTCKGEPNWSVKKRNQSIRSMKSSSALKTNPNSATTTTTKRIFLADNLQFDSRLLTRADMRGGERL